VSNDHSNRAVEELPKSRQITVAISPKADRQRKRKVQEIADSEEDGDDDEVFDWIDRVDVVLSEDEGDSDGHQRKTAPPREPRRTIESTDDKKDDDD
jgi:hypothetical protein